MVRETALHFLLGGRERYPHLQAVDRLAVDASFGPRALGMDDAAPGRHPVDFARSDRDRGTEAVAVHDLAVEQICNGGEANMRVRADIRCRRGIPRPKWSKMNGPTIRVRAEGSVMRRTAKSPRSTVRGTITWSIASHWIGIACGRILAGEETHHVVLCRALAHLSTGAIKSATVNSLLTIAGCDGSARALVWAYAAFKLKAVFTAPWLTTLAPGCGGPSRGRNEVVSARFHAPECFLRSSSARFWPAFHQSHLISGLILISHGRRGS